jgi:hypothetical protein
MKSAIKRDIIAWKIFRARDTFYDIAIVAYQTTSERDSIFLGLLLLFYSGAIAWLEEHPIMRYIGFGT